MMNQVQFSADAGLGKRTGAPARERRWVSELLEQGVTRDDAIAFARDLEQRSAEINREKSTPRNAMRLFPMRPFDPGAKVLTYEMYRHLGNVEWHRGNGRNIPRVGVDGVEESQNVRHAANAAATDPFEGEASAFASMNKGMAISTIAEKQLAARTAHEQFLNNKLWFGDGGQDIWGVLNFPYVARQVLAEPIGAADGDAFAQSLHALINTPSEITQGTESPDTLVVSTAAFNYMATTRLGDGTATTDTLLSYVVRTSPYLTRIEQANELNGAGPDGEDLCFAYRNDPQHIECMVARVAQAFPVFRDQMELVTPYVTTTAGVRMRYPASNIIGIFPSA